MSLTRRNRPPPRNGECQRRDPRTERESPAAETATTEQAARTRRDPRAERGPDVPPGEKRRIDRARPLRFVEETSVPERASTATKPDKIVINDPACWILAIPDLDNGRLNSHDRDVFGAARQLADAHNGAVVAITFGNYPDLDVEGADRVMPLAAGAMEWQATAIQAAIASLQPRHVVFPDSDSGGDIGRRVAAGLGEMPATSVQTVKADRINSRGDGGRLDFTREPPRLLLIAPEAANPVSGALHEARLIAPSECPEQDPRVIDHGALPIDPAAVPLAEADFIVSAGNGVLDWPAFHTLANTLGATEGCSRPVCDAGCLPRDRQIGASGTLVSARCYIALGISGAPQHLQGITDCEHVIAINADPHAEIMKRADLAVIADVQQLLPALTDLLNDGQQDDAWTTH